jgi:DNA-binding winged helix-turn-helix (wHTH) protein
MAALDEIGLEPRDPHSADFELQPAQSDSNRQLARRVRSSEVVFSFGSFRLLPARRLLLFGDEPVRLGSRALDILIVLVERAGELVGKDELMARVWPDTSVVPANLTVHVTALRRALRGGGRYFVNIPGRGYFFVAPVVLEVGVGGPAGQARADGYN